MTPPSDLALAVIWLAVLAAGVGLTVLARRLGLPATHARDLLHVGAGVWVLGWPWWNGLAAPLAIVAGAAVLVAAVPVAARRFESVDRFRRAVAGGDEAFGGLVVYTLSFAVMTALGLTAGSFPAAAGAVASSSSASFPAAAALLALAFGDGVGGLVGRRWGGRFYATPWGKRKSVEGSFAVAAFAAVGVAAAGAWLGAGIEAGPVVALGAVAALAEGLAPRGTDNALVPAAVWAAALMLA